MNRSFYKGYIIEASPVPVRRNQAWEVRVLIRRYDSGDRDSQLEVCTGNTFPRREDAVRMSSALGVDVIDGRRSRVARYSTVP